MGGGRTGLEGGQQALEIVLVCALGPFDDCERKTMIDKKCAFPMIRQAKLLDMSHSSVYYRLQPASESDLQLIWRIDELQIDYPFADARHASLGWHRRRTQARQHADHRSARSGNAKKMSLKGFVRSIDEVQLT